jgi:hypothetical protein
VITTTFVRRFRVTAGIVAAAVVLVATVLVILMIVVVPHEDGTSDIILIVVGALLLGALVGATIGSWRRAQALRAVAATHPDAVAFLARRQPSLVSDLAIYLGARGITADVADRWLVGMVDDRGISAWSLGSSPSELLLMPWAELGSIEVTDLESGGKGRGIAVDVRPFDTPLITAIGYSAFGLTSSLGRDGVAEVVAAANGLRPRI